MNEVEIIEPDLAKAADYVTQAWKQGVESIFEAGRRLVEVRARYHNDRGRWSRLIGDNQWKGQGLLPFGPSYAKMLVRIAERSGEVGLTLRVVGGPEVDKLMKQLVETASIAVFGSVDEAKSAAG